MGTGRGEMKKLFVDEINKQKDNSKPGPGRYAYRTHLGREGRQYTVAARLKVEEAMLERSKKLPGPGSYHSPEITGKTNL